jgi:hypothetical protein
MSEEPPCPAVGAGSAVEPRRALVFRHVVHERMLQVRPWTVKAALCVRRFAALGFCGRLPLALILATATARLRA